MARIHGRRGRLYVGLADDSATAEPVAYLSQWSLDSSTDKADVTAFGDTNKVSVSGLPNASGSFSGFYDTASDQLYTASRDGWPARSTCTRTSRTATTSTAPACSTSRSTSRCPVRPASPATGRLRPTS